MSGYVNPFSFNGYGVVPSAIAINLRGTDRLASHSGVFAREKGDAAGAGKLRRTELVFVNLPVQLTKGGTEDYGSVEIYDFQLDLVLLKGFNVDLNTINNDTTDIKAITTGWKIALGSAASINVASSATQGGDYVSPTACSTASGLTTFDARSTGFVAANPSGMPLLLDGTGTAKKVFLNLDGGVTGTSLNNTSTANGFLLNGTIEFQWEIVGSLLATVGD